MKPRAPGTPGARGWGEGDFEHCRNISFRTASNPPHPPAWAGREVDADTELQYNRARWHDPTVGRWLTRAPLGCDVSDGNVYPYPDRAADSH